MTASRKLLVEEFTRMKDVVGKDELVRLLDESIRSPLVKNGTLRYGQCIVNEVPRGIYSNIFNCHNSEVLATCGYNVAFS